MLIPSYVYHKVRLNMKLTIGEENEVRRAMGASFNKLKAVESETARLRERLVVLNQKKKDTEDFIKLHQGLLSPIRRLHPEILQDIFCRCLPIAHNSVLSFKEAPLLLGRVCSQWRQIAFSTPALWSSVHFVLAPLTSPGAKARLEAVDAWLSRSGILPLSISMSTLMLTSILTHMSLHELQPYFTLLAKHARRWKYIRLQVEHWNPMCFFTEIKADDLPLLEVFHIKAAGITFGSYSKGGIFSAPLLRYLSVQHPTLRLLDLPVQWSKLTGLASTYSNLSDLFTLLSLCSNLEACTLHVGPPYHIAFHPTMSESSNNNRPKIILPKLRTLVVYDMELTLNNAWSIILNNLFAPALRHFACALSHWSPPAFLGFPLPEHSSSEFFSSFFQRLDEPLEELDLWANTGETSQLMELLYFFPGLKRLSLKYFPSSKRLINDRLLLEFIPYEHRSHCNSCSLVEESEGEQVDVGGSVLASATCLCPNLEVLYVNGAHFSKHVLFEFLHSRLVDYDKYDIAPLRRFRIKMFTLRSEDDDMKGKVDWLAEKSGVLVELEHSPSSSAPAPLYEDPFIQELPVF